MILVPQPRPDEILQEGGLLARVWFRWVLAVTARLNGPPQLPEYTVAGMPGAGGARKLIWVSDAGGGAIPAYSDGTNWRRITDGTVIS